VAMALSRAEVSRLLTDVKGYIRAIACSSIPHANA
jgi:hypothetical protein